MIGHKIITFHLYSLFFLSSVVFSCSATAQVTPDNTLGSESSRIRRDAIKGIDSDVIEGGATRGDNLFHSLQQFSIQEGRGAYFANPADIKNILTRITGGNPSNILGTLGVLGNANLFLINPNGITFGPHARLDIRGAFVGSTADSLIFDNGFEFSVNNPQAPPLLTVNIPQGLRFRDNPRDISNAGNLSVAGDLTLKAGNLNLSGSLVAGGDLTLEALDTVKIRDTTLTPFMAASGGKLLIQGNQGVDIFALNHPESGFFSGGDLVLSSTNAVSGDAHFWSGGSFRIEQLDNSLGHLVSLHDPIIRSLGDVKFDAYQGTSLHILAAGKVEIPNGVIITGADVVNGLVETVTLSDGTPISINGPTEPTLDIRAGVDPVIVANSFFNPANYFPSNINAIFNPSAGNVPNLSTTVTSADIKIGTIAFLIFNPINPSQFIFKSGKILLTNQYQPNPALTGNIQVLATLPRLPRIAISTGDGRTNGGGIAIDSKGAISVNGNVSSSASPGGIGASSTGNGGDINLLAQNSINFAPNSIVSSLGLLGGNTTLRSQGDILLNGVIFQNESHSPISGLKGGNINIIARSLSLQNSSTNVASLSTRTFGRADSGDVNINVSDSIILDGAILLPNQGLLSTGFFTSTGSTGSGGEININAGSLSLTNGGQLNTTTSGIGNAGNVNINVRNAVILDGFGIGGFNTNIQSTSAGEMGNGGDINITAGSLSVTRGGGMRSDTFGRGNAGNINLDIQNAIALDGARNDGFSSLIFSVVNYGGVGNGGNVTISAGSLSLTNSAKISTRVERAFGNFPAGQGEAGNIKINVDGAIAIDGEGRSIDSSGQSNILVSTIESSLSQGAKGGAGDIEIQADSISLTRGGQIFSDTYGEGNAGNISLNLLGDISLAGTDSSGNFSSGISSRVQSQGVGRGGDISVKAGSLSITNNAILNSGTNGQGRGGNISVKAGSLFIANSSSLSASTSGRGDGGNIFIDIDNALNIDGTNDNFLTSGIFSTVQPGGIGNSGSVDLNAGTLSLNNGGQILTIVRPASRNPDGTIISPAGQGNGGDITIKANNITLDGFRDLYGRPINSRISSDVDFGVVGNAGTIDINTSSLSLTDGAVITTTIFPFAQGNGGNLTIKADDILLDRIDGSLSTGVASLVAPFAKGTAGNIDIQATNSLILINGSSIDSSLNLNAIGRGGDISITGRSLALSNNAQISASTTGKGSAGNITLNANEINLSQATVNAFTNGEGNAGSITLSYQGNNANQINLTNNSRISTEIGENGQSSAPSNITLKTHNLNLNNSTITASTAGKGDAGNITITGDKLTLTGKATIITNTTNTGKAGDIVLNLQDNLTLTNSSIDASTSPNSTGNGGNISIDPTQVSLTDSARISVNSQGKGDGGNIELTAQNLNLNNHSEISATTASGEGGNITLNVSDTLSLENNSPISATAGGTGNGGNITLNTEFLIKSENSDITANAFEGKGGNISITANGIFTDIDSGITASSQLGVDGVVETNTPEIDPSRGLVDLPETIVDSSSLINHNACKKGSRSEFTVSGRGGLPANPEQVQSSNETEVGLVEIAENSAKPVSVSSNRVVPKKIVPAQGWIRNAKGEFVLVADPASNANNQRQINSQERCN